MVQRPSVFTRNDALGEACSILKGEIHSNIVERWNHCWKSSKVKKEEITANDKDQLRNKAF